MGKTAIFVELDTLNVGFKVDDKFVAFFNYSSGIDRLSSTLPAFGAGYDIYLCMKPRAAGEGDMVVDALSIPGLPFTVDSEELYQVLKFFRSYSGCGDVFLTNWVSNYMARARVSTFRSVIYYGERVALLGVKSGVLETFRLFGSQRECVDELGSDYSGYGDLGLIDVDGLKAQYPELSEGSKAQLTAIAPLIQAYLTPVKVETTELYEQLCEMRKGGPVAGRLKERERKEADVSEDEALAGSTEIPGPVVELHERDEDFEAQRGQKAGFVKSGGRLSPVRICLTFVEIALALILGCSWKVSNSQPLTGMSPAYYTQMQDKTNQVMGLTELYRQADGVAVSMNGAFDYCHNSGLSIAVQEFSYIGGEFTLRCSYEDESVIEPFVSYLSNRYTIVNENDMGQAMSPDGKVIYHRTWYFIDEVNQ